MSSIRRRHTNAKQRGSTLLETCAVLTLSSIAAISALAGARPLACAVRAGAARTALTGALLEARQDAYANERNVVVEAHAGDASVILQPGNRLRSLGEGVRLASVPADGNVQFRASGLADNATLVVACDASSASVVVNQRGVIR